MKKKKICIIGQLPPPIHGLSAALKTIVENEYLNTHYTLQIIDIKDNKKFLNNLRAIKRMDADLYYFTISQSMLGNMRDMGFLKAMLKKKKKVIIHYHGGYYKHLYKKMNFMQKKINKKLISEIDIMVALSEGLKAIFCDVLDSEKIRVCENYVEDSSLIDENSFNEKLELMEVKNKIEVLYLSNFIKSKGYEDVLEVASQNKTGDLLFHFAGAFVKEDDKKQFFRFIKQNGLEDYVKYHGIVKGEAKKELLKNSDVFVLPTYYPNEGQPISIIEAMGNGLTIITTNHGGIADIVKEENGFLVEAKSPDQISEKLKHLLTNRKQILAFSRNNRNITLENFRETHYIKRLDMIFNEVFEK